MVSKIVNKFHELNQKYWKLAAALTFIAVLLTGYGLWYIFTHESTDDAFIEGDVLSSAPGSRGILKRFILTITRSSKPRSLFAI